MTYTSKAILLAVALLLVLNLGVMLRTKPPEPASVSLLSHQQEVWSYVLEWCESRGKVDAVNPEDRDGTPSYYAFQFKPETFAGFSQQYGIEGDIADYAAQRAIVEHMILDASITPKMWRGTLFPDCVKKYGAPPRS